MPLKRRKSDFIRTDAVLALNEYFSSWIDMGSSDAIIIYNGGGNVIELRGAVVDDPAVFSPDDTTSFPMTRFPSGSAVEAVINRNTLFSAPLPRLIALKALGNTTLEGYELVRKIA